MIVRNLSAFATTVVTVMISASPSWASIQPIAIPEPGTIAIFGLGIGAAILINRWKKK
jgi:hypothetical protein